MLGFLSEASAAVLSNLTADSADRKGHYTECNVWGIIMQVIWSLFIKVFTWPLFVCASMAIILGWVCIWIPAITGSFILVLSGKNKTDEKLITSQLDIIVRVDNYNNKYLLPIPFSVKTITFLTTQGKKYLFKMFLQKWESWSISEIAIMHQ